MEARRMAQCYPRNVSLGAWFVCPLSTLPGRCSTYKSRPGQTAEPSSAMNEKPDYAAMTVNERLYTANLPGAFDRAARSRNRERMIEILTEVEVGSPEKTADAIIENPGKYGY